MIVTHSLVRVKKTINEAGMLIEEGTTGIVVNKSIHLALDPENIYTYAVEISSIPFWYFWGPFSFYEDEIEEIKWVSK